MRRCDFLGAVGILLLAATASTAQDQAAVKVGKDRLDFLVGDKLATTYRFDQKLSKPVFWPVRAPGQIEVTRAWPLDMTRKGESIDHIHQKSAWFCHGDVIPEGLEIKHKIRGVEGIDFWSENKGHGNIVCVEVGKPVVQNGVIVVPTRNEWRTADGVKILDETRVLTFLKTEKGWILMVDSSLRAGSYPIVFGDTKEGSFGIRILDILRNDKVGKGVLSNSQGKKGEKECWGRIADWCDYSGPVGEKTVGLAVFADPKNPHPTCWHARGYGLLAANPFGRKRAGFPDAKNRPLVRLEKGEQIRFRYGLYAHEGDVSSGQVAEAFRLFKDR